MVALGRDSISSPLLGLDASLGHQTSNPVAPHTPKLCRMASRTRAAAMLLMPGHELANHFLSSFRTQCSGIGSCNPVVEAADGDLQQATEQLHSENGLLCQDECVSHGFSLAKKAAAFFRISRSTSTTRFSFSRALSCRLRSSISLRASRRAFASPRGEDTPAALLHLARVTSEMPSSLATSRTDLPLSIERRTAPSLNS